MAAELAEQVGDGGIVQLCRGISVSLGEWQEGDDVARQRSGTWQRWPFTYVFTEHAAPSRMGATYHLGRLSAQRVDTELHEFKGFYLDASGSLLHVVGLEVAPSELDRFREQIAGSIAFEVEHGFTAPSPEDYAEVEAELRQGFMDGVTPL
jgi:hypothetical protein